MDQAEQDRQSRDAQTRYEAAVSQRADPIGYEMEVLQTTYRQLSQLDPKAKARVMSYLNAVVGERLN